MSGSILTPSATPSVAQTAITTAEQTTLALVPVLVRAGAAGASAAAAASNPTTAVILEMLPDLMAMMQAGKLTKTQIMDIVSKTANEVETNQAIIDAYAKSRGVTDPTQTTPSLPVSGGGGMLPTGA